MNETARSKNVWLWLTIPIAASRRDSGSGLYSCCVAPRAGAWGPGGLGLNLYGKGTLLKVLKIVILLISGLNGFLQCQVGVRGRGLKA